MAGFYTHVQGTEAILNIVGEQLTPSSPATSATRLLHIVRILRNMYAHIQVKDRMHAIIAHFDLLIEAV